MIRSEFLGSACQVVNLICILPGLSPFQCCVNKKKPVFRFCWKNSFGPNVYGVRHECCTGSCQIMSCTLYGVRHEWCVLNSKQNEGNYDFNKHESQTWGNEVSRINYFYRNLQAYNDVFWRCNKIKFFFSKLFPISWNMLK